MKEEMKETIQEDIEGFKTWGAKNLTWLKKWWVRMIISITCPLITHPLYDGPNDDTILWGTFFALIISLYLLVVWLYGKDKNK